MEEEYARQAALKEQQLKDEQSSDHSNQVMSGGVKSNEDKSPQKQEAVDQQEEQKMNFAEAIANQMGNFSLGNPSPTKEQDQSTAETTQVPASPKNKKKKQQASGPASNIRSRIRAFQNQNKGFKKQKVGVVYDEEMLLHRCHRDYHPERPERAMAIYLNLVKQKLWDDLIRIDAEPAEDEDLLLAHPQDHIDKVKDIIYNNKTKKG